MNAKRGTGTGTNRYSRGFLSPENEAEQSCDQPQDTSRAYARIKGGSPSLSGQRSVGGLSPHTPPFRGGCDVGIKQPTMSASSAADDERERKAQWVRQNFPTVVSFADGFREVFGDGVKLVWAMENGMEIGKRSE